MDLLLLTADLVEAIHDEVLNPGELAGRAMNKSLESALARVDNRIAYGMTNDLFEIAALYAMAISQGHCFNDANKRTAHQSMDAFLDLNGIQITWAAEEVGQKIIALAQGRIDDGDLADWLRAHP
ncbi:MAG: type II toxin-antitoxin system death-on-curing family toxin [Paracoccaceae bacterium]